MVIKIFKISTKEMWTLKDKKALCQFIRQETGVIPNDKMKIIKLINYLPVENYCRVK